MRRRHIEKHLPAAVGRPPAARAARGRAAAPRPLPGWRCWAPGSAGRCAAAAALAARRRLARDAGRWRPARLPAPSPVDRPQPLRAAGHAAGARRAAHRLRPAGAGAGDQRGDDPPADPARRRGRGRRGRGLLRRARPSHGPRAAGACATPGATSTPGRASSTAAVSMPIVINASGCGTTVKDYGFMFRDDPAYAEKAARVSALARDVSELLASSGSRAGRPAAGWRSPIMRPARCSTASRSASEPKQLLARGRLHRAASRAEGPSLLRLGRHLQPAAARDRRAAARPQGRRTSSAPTPDVIATGNIGCISQIGLRHRCRRAHGRAARLGDRRPGTAGPGAEARRGGASQGRRAR